MSHVMAEAAYPDLAETIERTHRSVEALVDGDPEPQKRLWSRRDDITLANPLGGFRRGWPAVEEGLDGAAAGFRAGSWSCVFQEVTRLTGSDFGYVFEIERFDAQLTAPEGSADWALRVTMVFRLEEGRWKLVHRQADPLTEHQPLEPSIHDR
jgi:ketosteroid isomerase-like protein